MEPAADSSTRVTRTFAPVAQGLVLPAGSTARTRNWFAVPPATATVAVSAVAVASRTAVHGPPAMLCWTSYRAMPVSSVAAAHVSLTGTPVAIELLTTSAALGTDATGGVVSPGSGAVTW